MSSSTGSPLNILFVQEMPCIRNYKYTQALTSKGHKVSLAYGGMKLSEVYQGLKDDIYENLFKIEGHREFWDLTGEYDVVHCHNTPDIYTVLAMAGDAPVIHDTHDMQSLLKPDDGNASILEGIANRGADARVYVSEGLRQEADRLYGPKSPSLVFSNYVSKCDLPKNPLPKLSDKDGETHIVYEGHVASHSHRSIVEFLVELANRGLHVHMYTREFFTDLADHLKGVPRFHYHKPTSPKYIISKMTQYDFGVIPWNLIKGNRRFLDASMPNKLFEYLAAGLPVLGSPVKSLIDYFQENPVGMIFESAEDLVAKIPELRKSTSAVDLKNYAVTYEDNLYKIEELYQYVMENGRRRKR